MDVFWNGTGTVQYSGVYHEPAADAGLEASAGLRYSTAYDLICKSDDPFPAGMGAECVQCSISTVCGIRICEMGEKGTIREAQ